MADDPIVDEVRRARARLAERCDHDLRKIVEYIKERERESGHRLVSRPPNRVEEVAHDARAQDV